MYYTYILQLRDKTYYTGNASELQRRLREHIQGVVASTRNLRPVKLVFYASFISKQKAIQFEKYLKSSSGSAFRNKHLVDK